MISRTQLLIDLLFHHDSDPKERVIIEISGRLRILPNHTAHLLKELRSSGLVCSPSSLVAHPLARRKVKNYILTETGKREAELIYESVKNKVILVKVSNDNFRKVSIEKLPETLGYDIKALSSILSLVKRKVLDTSELKNIIPPPADSKNLIHRIGELTDGIRTDVITGRIHPDDINNLSRIKYSIEEEIGYLCMIKGNYAKAIIHFKNALSYAKKSRDFRFAAKVYADMGRMHSELEKFKLAIESYKKCIAFARKVKDRNIMGTVLLGMGGTYEKMAEFQKAKLSLKKAAVFFMKTGDTRSLASAYQSLGNIYMTFHKDYRNAAIMYEKSLQIRDEINDKLGSAAAYSALGGIKSNLGSHLDSIKLFEKSIKICKELDYKLLLAFNYCKLADIYVIMKDFEMASRAAKSALDISRTIGAIEYECNARIIRGTIFSERGKWKTASTLFDKAIETARKNKMFVVLCKAYLMYGSMEKSRGRIGMAKRYLNYGLKIATVKKMGLIMNEIRENIRNLTRYSK